MTTHYTATITDDKRGNNIIINVPGMGTLTFPWDQSTNSPALEIADAIHNLSINDVGPLTVEWNAE